MSASLVVIAAALVVLGLVIAFQMSINDGGLKIHVSSRAQRIGRRFGVFGATMILLVGAAYAVASVWPYEEIVTDYPNQYLMVAPNVFEERPNNIYTPDENLVVYRGTFCNYGVATTTDRFIETKADNDGQLASVFDTQLKFEAPLEPGCFEDTFSVIPIPDDATSDRIWRFRTVTSYEMALGRVVSVENVTPWFQIEGDTETITPGGK